ncbi:MAG: UDP-N-acetylmuramoyl-L-alanine--D-glutamate ligase [Cyanobium sp. MAG06]|nr:UDP-N-acetylmuramoyl-L-alanine--D-glutamate ligase [Cyanobium sp. MAG06]
MLKEDDIKYLSYFQGKRVTKQGFGILGRGLGVVRFLIDAGADIIITDTKDQEIFQSQIEEINKYITDNNLTNKIEYHFSGHREEDFINCDYVIQASGVPKDNKYLQLARDNNIPVYQESSLFLKIINEYNNQLEEKDKIKVIGITGTRGKTTTTMLLYKILSDIIGIENIHLGGNIRDIATLAILKNIKRKDIVLMEMDSWILQGLGYIKYSPNIAVWTTFMQDHLNYYKGDMKEYFYDKANIFLNQKERDICITTTNIYSDFSRYLNMVDINNVNSSNNIKYLNTNDIMSYNIGVSSKLIGEHNKLNIALAIAVCEYLRLDKERVLSSISNFQPVEGRLELINNINGIDYYNDSTSTTPDALMAGISAMSKPLILICGGRDKEIGLDDLVRFLILNKENNKIKKIVLLKDDSTTGTDRLIETIHKYNKDLDYLLASNMTEAINIVDDVAVDGDAVLFSPGFASFGMFQNEYDRSDQFKKTVESIGEVVKE